VQKTLGYEESEGKQLFRDLASAVHFTHSHGFIHRDIKLENLLLAIDGQVRLADWGFARRFDSKVLLKEFCGSVHYAAPELVNGIAYVGPEVDIWSLGVTLYGLISARLPFSGSTQQAVLRSIQQGFFVMPESFSEDLKDLIRKMLEVNPTKRYKIEEILAHPWLKNEVELEKAERTPIRFRSLSGPIIATISNTSVPSESPASVREKKARTLQTFWRNLVRRRMNRIEVETSKKSSFK
jgi:serine/threonine protein kinase